MELGEERGEGFSCSELCSYAQLLHMIYAWLFIIGKLGLKVSLMEVM